MSVDKQVSGPQTPSKASRRTPQDEAQLAAQNWEEFSAAFDARHAQFVKDADRFNRFYLGDQWDPDVKRRIESQGRPVLTINQILTTVNAVVGEHSHQRVDIQFKPRTHADSDTAMVLTHVVDHVLDVNKYQYQEARCFADGLIMDAGFLDVRMDFDRNILGEVEIRSLDPMDVVIDPEAKEYDPASWTRVFMSRWHTLDEIESLYGKDKRKKLEGLVLAGGTYGNNSVRFADEKRFGDVGQDIAGLAGPEAMGRLRGLRIIEQQRRQLTMRKMFVDLSSGDTKPVPENWEEEKIQQVVEQYKLGVMQRVQSRIRWIVTCDHVVLHDDWSPYEDFTVVPFFPFFRRGRFSGLVRQLISPQEQLNKVESQQLHVVNTTANSGYLVEEGSLANMTPEELEQRGAETGLVVVYRKGRQPPEKIQPNQIPTGLDRLGSKALSFLHEISGTEALLGKMPSSEVSGVAMERSEMRGLVKLQPILDNLAYTRHLVADRILRLVQVFYNETRVMRVTDWRDPTEPEVEVTINQPTPSGEIVNNLGVGTYDVVVSTAPARDGALETEFAEAVQLVEIGVPIPPEVIVRASHLVNKHEVAEEIKKMQGRGEPTDQEAQMMQMQQQMMMQQMQLQLAELEAKAQKLQAEAALYAAKAKHTEMQTQAQPASEQARMELDLQRLQYEIAQAKADLETKIELARINTQSRNAQTLMESMSQRVDTERKITGQLEAAKIAAAARANRSKTQPGVSRGKPRK